VRQNGNEMVKDDEHCIQKKFLTECLARLRVVSCFLNYIG
jgi:hypothetical protein